MKPTGSDDRSTNDLIGCIYLSLISQGIYFTKVKLAFKGRGFSPWLRVKGQIGFQRTGVLAAARLRPDALVRLTEV